MTEFGMSVTVSYEGNVDKMELKVGGRIIFPQVVLKMTTGDTTVDVTDNTPISGGMRSIKNEVSWYDK